MHLPKDDNGVYYTFGKAPRMSHYDPNVVKLLLICDALQLPHRIDCNIDNLWSRMRQSDCINHMMKISLDYLLKALQDCANTKKHFYTNRSSMMHLDTSWSLHSRDRNVILYTEKGAPQ